MKVLGLCKNSVLDLHYALAGDKNGYPHFTGSRRSHIFWSPENQTYVMQSLWNNQMYGVMKVGHAKGIHKFKVRIAKVDLFPFTIHKQEFI